MKPITRTVDECLRDRAVSIPDRPIISYPSQSGEYEEYTALTLHLMTERASKHYRRSIPLGYRHVVALLGVSNLEYIVSFLALQRLGLTCLFLSTRLPDNAFLHLLRTTNCSHVIAQPFFHTAMNRVKASHTDLQIITMATAGNIKSPILDFAPAVPEVDPESEVGHLAWIIHSSGSTGLPKPVEIRHGGGAVLGMKVRMQVTDYGYTALPLFHAYGLYTLVYAIHSGIKSSFHSAELPLTGPNMMEGIQKTGSRVLYCVPYTLKVISETPGGLDMLKTLRQITMGGSSCPDDLGEMLVKAGVNVQNHYGSTETGTMMRRSDDAWNWLRLLPRVHGIVRFEPVSDGEQLYELVCNPGYKLNGKPNRPDGSYATRDLFRRHLTDHSKWKYVGRLDDTIVLSNGEKANPIAIEDAVRKNPLVTEAVVFGAEKPTLGLIVILSENSVGISEKDIHAKIMPDIEAGNQLVPAYGRIHRDAIIFKKAGTLFPKTDKGNVIRAAFVNQFSDEIENYYRNAEQMNAKSGSILSEDEIKEVVRETVANELKIDAKEIEDITDFFSLGMDSLMAISARRALAREINTGGKILGNNVVFEYPNVEILSRYLHSLQTGEEVKKQNTEEILEGLVKKYSNFKKHVPGNVSMDGQYILLTGATGSLGAHILSQLIKRLDVKRVYCPVRAGTPHMSRDRVLGALENGYLLRGHSVDHLQKIVTYPSNFAKGTLGLSPAAYREVIHNITTVIHCAWSVNFNLDVTSFEEQQIKGTKHLLDICLSSPHASPPSFNFISSISAAAAIPGPTIPERLPTLRQSVRMGYAQSKLVTETILTLCDSVTTRILRIGQIVGDTQHGVWNPTEAWPLSVQSALTIGALPRISGGGDEELSWLPVDTTASAVLELSLDTDSKETIFHVCHPKTLYWNRDFLPALRAAGLVFEEVDQVEWLMRLKEDTDARRNPPVKLLTYFEGKYGRKGAAAKGIEIKNAAAASRSVREAKEVDAELVAKFLRYWKSVWVKENKGRL